jgi:hypothetical protein
MPLTETRDLVLFKRYVCDLFGDLFNYLRGWWKTLITQLINMPNKNIFLRVCKLFTCIRGSVFIRACYASMAPRQRRAIDFPFLCNRSIIYTILRF